MQPLSTRRCSYLEESGKYYVTRSLIVTSELSLFACRLERKIKSGNEAGNETTGTEIGTLEVVGVVVDLTGVKVKDDPVGHAVRVEEVLTGTWIETGEEEQVCFSF